LGTPTSMAFTPVSSAPVYQRRVLRFEQIGRNS
jgi:hypothetical protein